MKEIIFVRHAKSDWENEMLKDVDRHLNERGSRDAYFLSEWFMKQQQNPDLILSSTATRALSTALVFARTMDFDMSNFCLEKKIYESTSATLISLLKEQNDSKHRIMLFGHNPGISNVCNELSKDTDFDNIPTCSIVSFSFDIKHWQELKNNSGNLNYFQFPKDFKNQD